MSMTDAETPATFEPLVQPGPPLTSAQAERYARHAILPGIGVEGQRRLLNAKVLVLGAGGLGSPVLLYLAAAGVGHLGIVDSDDVDLSNLQRQVIHSIDSIGRPKVHSARDALHRLDPDIQVTAYHGRLTAENALDVMQGWDIVVDGCDNFATRYLVADACEILGIPCVWGSILRFDGQATTFWPGRGPLYRDVFPAPPDPRLVPSCAEAGVVGALCAAVGSVLAMEVVRLVTGAGTNLVGRLLIHDALAATWRELRLRPDPTREPVTELADYEALCGVPGGGAGAGAAGGSAGSVEGGELPTVTAEELAVLVADRDAGDQAFTLVDVREPGEFELVRIDSAQLIPKGEVVADPGLVPADKPAVLYCKGGVRSAEALAALIASGRDDVWHLDGGILAWIDQIEPHKPRY